MRTMIRTGIIIFIFSMLFLFGRSHAMIIANPEEIEVQGLVSRGEDGAAWLKYADKLGSNELLVSPGFMIGNDLRVTAVRHDCVVLYKQRTRAYYALSPKTKDLPWKDNAQVIWCTPMPLWKIIRMVALANRKDYICHFETSAESAPCRHVPNMDVMLENCVKPHHRFHGREGIIYVSPVHIRETSWQWFLNQVRTYHSEKLIRWFPALEKTGTIISNGQDLSRILDTIKWKTGVPIKWQDPEKLPIYCSLKDRPWHQILENILLFNGLSLTPTQENLAIIKGWK